MRDLIIAFLATMWLTSGTGPLFEMLAPRAEGGGSVVEGDQLVIGGPGPHSLGTSGVQEPALKLKTMDPQAQFTLHVANIFGQDNVRDDVLFLGYNATGAGAQEIFGEPSLRFSIESHYRTNASDFMEYNLDYTSADATVSRRFLAFNVERTTHEAAWAFAGNILRIERDMNDSNFIFVPSGVRRTVFRNSGGAGELVQVGYDGGTSAPDRIQIGPSAMVNPEFQIKRAQLALAGEVAILVYGNYGTPGPKQVKVGPPDSGGPGFRALIVPNN